MIHITSHPGNYCRKIFTICQLVSLFCVQVGTKGQVLDAGQKRNLCVVKHFTCIKCSVTLIYLENKLYNDTSHVIPLSPGIKCTHCFIPLFASYKPQCKLKTPQLLAHITCCGKQHMLCSVNYWEKLRKLIMEIHAGSNL